MKILFFGDVIGKIGRQALTKVLPKYKKKYKPDLIIANGENLAHGKGITMVTVEEMFTAGIDILTSGNHVFSKTEYQEVFTNYQDRVIRPANYPETVEGKGYTTMKIEDRRVVIINLMGRVFMQENFDDPFVSFDKIEKLLKIGENDIVIIDFHAEATSEKIGFCYYVDGRATAVLGTHTHVPTADTRILSQGTAFVTDAGMVGALDSIIGVEKSGPLNLFLTQINTKFEMPEEGKCQVNAVLVEIEKDSRVAKSIKRVDEEVIV